MRPLPVQGEVRELPLSLPLAHFLALACWFGLFALSLPWIQGDLTAGAIFSPRVFAATHLATLGVAGTAIFGALYQFIPAVLGVPIRSRRVGWTGYGLLVSGVAALVSGMWRWRPVVQASGWVLLFGAVGCVSWNILPARRRATRNRIIGWFVSLSHSWLGVAMALALVRIGDGLGWWHTERSGLIAAHFHIGALGFASLAVVGVGSVMFPGFLGSRGQSERPLRWIGWLDSIGLVLFAAGTLLPLRSAQLAGGALLALGAVGHLAVVADYYRRRGQRKWEPGLGFIATAFGFQLAALVAGLGLLLRGSGPGRGWAAYAILVLAGWLVLLILGVLHRVAPRLVAQRIAARRSSRSRAEGTADLIQVPLAWASLALLSLGTAGLAGAVALGNRVAGTAAVAAYLGGAGLILLQAGRLLRR